MTEQNIDSLIKSNQEKISKIEELSRLVNEQKLQISSLKMRVGKYEKKSGSESQTSQVTEAATVETAEELKKEPSSDKQKHSFELEGAGWQQKCLSCGAQNPKFKDEAMCGKCGLHLGAAEDAKKMEHCPGCGASGNVLRHVH